MKYFILDEFTCKHCDKLPEKGMSPVLLEKLDQLREKWGHPIYVSSAYRCPPHNAAVGGVSNSQHLYGTAADIYTNDGDYEEFYKLCLTIGFDAVGYYPRMEFVHVDCRCGGNAPNCFKWEG